MLAMITAGEGKRGPLSLSARQSWRRVGPAHASGRRIHILLTSLKSI